MTYAYDKSYLEKARTTLGRMLDFAVNEMNYAAEVFFEMFIESGMARKFERGDSAAVAGRSGVETAYEVVDYMIKAKGMEGAEIRIEVSCPVNRTPEYWAGWALAYYQWITGLDYAQIRLYIPINEIVEMYHPFHEMDIRQFCDRMDELYHMRKADTNLKLRRRSAGYSQRELSELSRVPLRTIQQYEQSRKNINHASAETVLALARALACEPEKLME